MTKKSDELLQKSKELKEEALSLAKLEKIGTLLAQPFTMELKQLWVDHLRKKVPELRKQLHAEVDRQIEDSKKDMDTELLKMLNPLGNTIRSTEIEPMLRMMLNEIEREDKAKGVN